MATDKRGLSALLLQRQLGLRRYETAWLILHKLRRAMVNFSREPLQGEVEIDETCLGGPQTGIRGSRQLKGRKAALVAVAVEKRGTRSGRIRMEVIPNFGKATMDNLIQRNVAPGSTVYTDGLVLSWPGPDQNQARCSQSTLEIGAQPRGKLHTSTGRSGHWKPKSVARRYSPRCESPPSPGLP